MPIASFLADSEWNKAECKNRILSFLQKYQAAPEGIQQYWEDWFNNAPPEAVEHMEFERIIQGEEPQLAPPKFALPPKLVVDRVKTNMRTAAMVRKDKAKIEMSAPVAVKVGTFVIIKCEDKKEAAGKRRKYDTDVYALAHVEAVTGDGIHPDSTLSVKWWQARSVGASWTEMDFPAEEMERRTVCLINVAFDDDKSTAKIKKLSSKTQQAIKDIANADAEV